MDAQDEREQAYRDQAEQQFWAKPDRQRPWFLRRARWWVGPLILLAVIAGPIAWKAYTESQLTVDIPAIEQAIQDDQTDQGFDVTVNCPDSIDWDVGGEFHCLMVDSEDARYRVAVSMENKDGDVTWVFE